MMMIIIIPSNSHFNFASLPGWQSILQFLDTGLMSAWKKRFWPVASRCVSGTKKQPVRALNLLDAAGTLLLLLGGALLASTLLLGEILLGRMISSN